MKKLGITMMMLVFTVSIFAGQAATEDEKKFLGLWDLLMKDLPDGDMTMQMEMKIEDGKLTGAFVGEEVMAQMGEPLKLYDIEVDGDELSFMYTAQGYDVSIVVELESEKMFSGFMMDMFEVEGTKVEAK